MNEEDVRNLVIDSLRLKIDYNYDPPDIDLYWNDTLICSVALPKETK